MLAEALAGAGAELVLSGRDSVELEGAAEKLTPAGRWGKVEELPGTVVFLASRASDFVNGQTIHFDCGITVVMWKWPISPVFIRGAGDVGVEPHMVGPSGSGEAIVHVAVGGICGSDLSYFRKGAPSEL